MFICQHRAQADDVADRPACRDGPRRRGRCPRQGWRACPSRSRRRRATRRRAARPASRAASRAVSSDAAIACCVATAISTTRVTPPGAHRVEHGFVGFGRVARHHRERRRDAAMGHRDSGQRRRRDRRAHAGNDFERNARRAERQRFLAAAAEHEGIAALQAHDSLARAGRRESSARESSPAACSAVRPACRRKSAARGAPARSSRD